MLRLKRKQKKTTFNLKGLTFDDLTALAACIDLAGMEKVQIGYMSDMSLSKIEDILNDLWDSLTKDGIIR